MLVCRSGHRPRTSAAAAAMSWGSADMRRNAIASSMARRSSADTSAPTTAAKRLNARRERSFGNNRGVARARASRRSMDDTSGGSTDADPPADGAHKPGTCAAKRNSTSRASAGNCSRCIDPRRSISLRNIRVTSADDGPPSGNSCGEAIRLDISARPAPMAAGEPNRKARQCNAICQFPAPPTPP